MLLIHALFAHQEKRTRLEEVIPEQGKTTYICDPRSQKSRTPEIPSTKIPHIYALFLRPKQTRRTHTCMWYERTRMYGNVNSAGGRSHTLAQGHETGTSFYKRYGELASANISMHACMFGSCAHIFYVADRNNNSRRAGSSIQLNE